MADTGCPSCGTLLRKAQAGPDGHIRCPNCGKRFAADAPASSPSAPNTAAATAPPGREPPAAHYGLVVVLGIVLLLGTCAASVPLLFKLASEFFPVNQWVRLDKFAKYMLLISATAGLPFLGIVFVQAARQFGSIDRHALRVVWRLGGLKEPLPAPPGSSLPYILPFCVSGGVLLLASLQSIHQQGLGTSEFLWILVTMLSCCILALVGLGLGELRRFLWRLEQAGQRIAAPNGAPAGSLLRAIPWAWKLSIAIFLFSILCIVFADRANMTGIKLTIWLGIGFGLAGGAYSFARISHDARGAIAVWTSAAAQNMPPSTAHAAWPMEILNPRKSSWFGVMAYVWSLLTLLFILALLIENWSRTYGQYWAQILLFLPSCLVVAILAWSVKSLHTLGFQLGLWAGWAKPRTGQSVATIAVFWLGMVYLLGVVLLKRRSFGRDDEVLLLLTAPLLLALWVTMACEFLRAIAQSLEEIERKLTP